MTNKELEVKFRELENKVMSYLEKMEQMVVKLTEEKVKVVEPIVPTYDLKLPTTSVPLEYRAYVDTVLNKDFEVAVRGITDMPAFEFTIIVPEKYSTMTPSQKSMMHQDLRPKVVQLNEGMNGVREWVDRVWKSFGPDIQNRIYNDRLQNA